MFLFLLLYIPEFVTGQEQNSSNIFNSFSYDIGINWLKEENLFPIVHKGSINGLTYRFEKRGKNYYEIAVLLRYSKIKSKLETEKGSQNAQISISHCMGFHLIRGEKIDFFMGYNLKYLISFLDFPVWDESRAYWGTSLTQGISNRLFINTKKNQCWITGWDINPLGLFSRPDEVRLYAQENYTHYQQY